MKEFWDTPEGKQAVDEASRVLQEEIDKYIVEQLVTLAKQIPIIDYDRAMEIVDGKKK